MKSKVVVKEEITALMAAGRSYADIASEMSVSEAAVRRWHKGDRAVHAFMADALKRISKTKPGKAVSHENQGS